MSMDSNVKSAFTFGVGFLGGWAARSLADSPQGAGVKLLEIAMNAKERIGRWAAVESDRLEDMLAEARSRAEPDTSRAPRAQGAPSNGPAHEAQAPREDA
jgi:hypothetical protein